jgi:hypothetical protein
MVVIALAVVAAFVASVAAALGISVRRAASLRDSPTVDAALARTLLGPRGPRPM